MTRLQNTLILIALTMFIESAPRCAGTADTRSEALSTVSEETLHSQKKFTGED
jgi:hypothetical protein